MAEVDDDVRQALVQRVEALAAQAAAGGGGTACTDTGTRPLSPSLSALAALRATLAREAQWRDAHAVDGLPAHAAYPALPALQSLRVLWAQLRVEGQTRAALAPATADAGPLNSAGLVHRTLTLMRDEAPGYLHHLMAYLDVLSGLEQMQAGGTLGATPPAATPEEKRARAPKAGRK